MGSLLGYYAPSTNIWPNPADAPEMPEIYTVHQTIHQTIPTPRVASGRSKCSRPWMLAVAQVTCSWTQTLRKKGKVKRWRLWEGMIRYDCMIGISCMYALLLMILMEEWLRKAWFFSPLRPKLTELYRHIFACLDQDAQTTKEAIPISLRRERPAVGGKHWHWALHGDEMKKGSILPTNALHLGFWPNKLQSPPAPVSSHDLDDLAPAFSVCLCVCGTGCSIDELAQNISLEVRKQLDATTSIKWWSQFIHSDLAEVHLICYLVQVWTKNWSTERRLV